MTNLAAMTCQSCKAADLALSENELQEWLVQLPDWQTCSLDHGLALERLYSFNSYQQATSFSNALFKLASESNHHPQIIVEWRKVRLRWWTHRVNGLHINDFICAAKSDVLFAHID